MAILNVIFLSDSCIKLYSLGLCIIQQLSTFELNLLSKILFLLFWRLFYLSIMSNTVCKIVQKPLIIFLYTFYYLEGLPFHLQVYLENYKLSRYLLY